MDFGRWMPVHHLATGGMAELFVALDRQAPGGTRSPYVVKQLSPHLAARPAFANMFADEARLGLLLQHPNLVRTVAVGTTDNVPYYAMEYVSGYDIVRVGRELRRQKRRLPLFAAVSIGVQLCRALSYAHALRDRKGNFLNVVHRDVSPGNVMVGIDGVVKLLDFGIAKRERRLEETEVGAVKGKVRYMSPEQASAGAVDHRSDIFSASILLWELTVWRRLFTQRTAFEAVQAIVGEDIPEPASVCRNYPAPLNEIVNKGLERSPGDRFQSADEMAEALERFAIDFGLDLSSEALARFINELFAEQDTLITQPQVADGSASGLERMGGAAGTRRAEQTGQSPGAKAAGGEPGRVSPSSRTFAWPAVYIVVAALGLALAHVWWAPEKAPGRGAWARGPLEANSPAPLLIAASETEARLSAESVDSRRIEARPNFQAAADPVVEPQPDRAPEPDQDQPGHRGDEQAVPEPEAERGDGLARGQRGAVCSARLTSTPRRVRVRWNGTFIGTTPLDLEVPCGEAEVRMFRAGYEARTVSAVATPTEAVELAVELEAHEYSRLRLVSRPGGARFRINGKAVGAGPLVQRLRAGRSYRISATRPGYAVWEATVRARRSDRQITAELAPFGPVGKVAKGAKGGADAR